jgi:hypothetical protein
MANETMRIFFPLKIFTYPQGEYDWRTIRRIITSSGGCGI